MARKKGKKPQTGGDKNHKARVERHKARVSQRGAGQMNDLSGGAQQRLTMQLRGSRR